MDYTVINSVPSKKKKKCTRTWPWKANTSRNLTTCHNFTGHWPSSRTQTNHTPWTSNSQKHPRVSLKNHNSTLSETPKAFSLSFSLSRHSPSSLRQARLAFIFFSFFSSLNHSLIRFIDPTVQVSPPMTMMTPPPLDVHTNSLSLSLYLFPLYIFSIYRRHWFLAQFWYPRVSGSIQRHRNGFDF